LGSTISESNCKQKGEIDRAFYSLIVHTDITVIKKNNFSILKEKGNLKQAFKGRIFRSCECHMWIQKTRWNQVRRAKYSGKPHDVL